MTKVLVVDDEIDIRELLIDELTDSGYETIEAENGAEALDRVYSDHPDIVLLDLMMPVLDGIQVLEVLKFNANTANLPVVLLTAVSANEGEQRAMDLGVNHYVTKPWEPGTIQTVIKVTLREAAKDNGTIYGEEKTTAGDVAGEEPGAGETAGEEASVGDVADEEPGAGETAGEEASVGDAADEETGVGDAAVQETGAGHAVDEETGSGERAGLKTISGNGSDDENADDERPGLKKIFGGGSGENAAKVNEASGRKTASGGTGQETETSAFISTGDPQLNLKLGGGVPREGMTFIEGGAATGKSVLCQHFANAALVHGFGVSYFSSQHSATSLVSQMTSLGLDPSAFYSSNQLSITPIPIIGSSSDCKQALLDLARQVKDMAANFRFVIVDDLAGVTNRDEESAIINFVNQCKVLGSSGNSIVIAAHPDSMSEDVLIRVRSLSDGYLGLRLEKTGSRLNKVLEVFKVANAEFQTGNRVNFEVEPGMGIRVNAITKVNG